MLLIEKFDLKNSISKEDRKKDRKSITGSNSIRLSIPVLKRYLFFLKQWKKPTPQLATFDITHPNHKFYAQEYFQI